MTEGKFVSYIEHYFGHKSIIHPLYFQIVVCGRLYVEPELVPSRVDLFSPEPAFEPLPLR